MNFAHDDQRQMLADMLNRFIADRADLEARNAATAAREGYDTAVWAGLAELGVIGALVDADAGGFGGTGFEIMILFEALGRGLVTGPFLDALLASRILAAAGGFQDVLDRVISGQTVVAFAHHEPDGRYDLDQVETRAVRDGDGWRLDGAKAVVAHAGSAHQFLVSARSDTGDLLLLLVPADAPGLRVRDYANIDGGRAGELTLMGVTIGADARVGMEENAAALIETAYNAALLALSAEALGAAETATSATIDFLRVRQQFGVALGSFQALQHRMADVMIDKEQLRSAVINAAAALDQDRQACGRAASAAKYTAGKVGASIAEEAIQLHGGIGMTWELPVSHYAKRLIMIDHQFGDQDHHLARYIALGADAN